MAVIGKSASELEDLAREHGWRVVHGTRSTSFKRPGGGYVHVTWNRNLAVLRAFTKEGGAFRDITGRGKAAQVRELLTRDP